MTTLEISLPDTLKEFVERQVASGSFRDASEYVQSLLEQASLEQEHARIEAQQRTQIDAELLKRVAAVERGEASEMTARDWQRLKTEYREHMGKREGS